MAKYRHRIFEIYEERNEAIGALTPSRFGVEKTKPPAPLPSEFGHLSVSRTAFVTHVRLNGTAEFTNETEPALREDLIRLADELEIDSKVLLDFENVQSVSASCIEAMAAFQRKLRKRGSRVVLCCLAPDARACFYTDR